MTVDGSGWSGEGDFTQAVIEALRGLEEVAAVRVEDSPASRSDAGFAFLSNEIFVTFAMRPRAVRGKWLGLVPVTRTELAPAMDLEGLAAALGGIEGIGEPDYRDEGMMQYLRAERVKAAWQSKGIKLVEMVRIYRAGATRRE